MTLFYNGGNGVYNIEKRLAPGEQIWADVGRIIREQIPDRDGHTIPPTVTSGSSELWDLDHPGLGHVFEGKLLLDKTYGRAFYGCNICCRQYGAALHVTPFSGPVGSGDYDTVTYRECDGTEYDGTWMAYGWYSCNTSIATLPDRYLSLVGVGSTTTKANIDLVTSRCQPYTDQPQQSVASNPRFNVAYSSYIPVDHVNGPSSCTYQSSSFTKIYKGDANRGTYRTTESIWVTPDMQSSSGFFQDTGETRNYGAGSPANGSTLSAADEDSVALDCLLWNQSGKATPGFSHDETYPYLHQGQVHYSGAASNPLEDRYAPITWDMRTVIDTTNPLSPTAYVNYNHTCYPSHQIKVNGAIVYLYTPPRNDISFITQCLFFQTGKIIGQTSPTGVPPQ